MSACVTITYHDGTTTTLPANDIHTMGDVLTKVKEVDEGKRVKEVVYISGKMKWKHNF